MADKKAFLWYVNKCSFVLEEFKFTSLHSTIKHRLDVLFESSFQLDFVGSVGLATKTNVNTSIDG